MPEKLPEGVTSIADYQTEKARASLEAAAVLEEINFPADFETLHATSPDIIKDMQEALGEKMEDLSLDSEGNVRNENRHTVELLAQRRRVLDELLDSISSAIRAAEMFDAMDPA